MLVISMFQRKGGVGKTTVATNLGQVLSLIDKKVLLIDNDSQANLTSSVGLKSAAITLTDLYKNLDNISNEMMAGAIRQSFLGNLFCITADIGLDFIAPKREAMKKIISHPVIQYQEFDYIIIDNCAATDPKTQTAIRATDAFIIPVQLEQLALFGLKQAFEMLTTTYAVPKERIFIVRNFLDKTNLSMASSVAIEGMYPENVVPHVLGRSSNDLQLMISSEKSLFVSKSRTKITGQFLDVACDLFGFNRDDIWKTILKKINEFRTENLKEYCKTNK